MLPEEPIEIPITDILDLHSVPSEDVRAVVEAWLEEVKIRGWRALRIIHGRGVGVRREMIRSLLSRDHDVVDYRDAPAEAGGWGATIITLREKPKQP